MIPTNTLFQGATGSCFEAAMCKSGCKEAKWNFGNVFNPKSLFTAAVNNGILLNGVPYSIVHHTLYKIIGFSRSDTPLALTIAAQRYGPPPTDDSSMRHLMSLVNSRQLNLIGVYKLDTYDEYLGINNNNALNTNKNISNNSVDLMTQMCSQIKGSNHAISIDVIMEVPGDNNSNNSNNSNSNNSQSNWVIKIDDSDRADDELSHLETYDINIVHELFSVEIVDIEPYRAALTARYNIKLHRNDFRDVLICPITFDVVVRPYFYQVLGKSIELSREMDPTKYKCFNENVNMAAFEEHLRIAQSSNLYRNIFLKTDGKLSIIYVGVEISFKWLIDEMAAISVDDMRDVFPYYPDSLNPSGTERGGKFKQLCNKKYDKYSFFGGKMSKYEPLITTQMIKITQNVDTMKDCRVFFYKYVFPLLRRMKILTRLQRPTIENEDQIECVYALANFLRIGINWDNLKSLKHVIPAFDNVIDELKEQLIMNDVPHISLIEIDFEKDLYKLEKVKLQNEQRLSFNPRNLRTPLARTMPYSKSVQEYFTNRSINFIGKEYPKPTHQLIANTNSSTHSNSNSNSNKNKFIFQYVSKGLIQLVYTGCGGKKCVGWKLRYSKNDDNETEFTFTDKIVFDSGDKMKVFLGIICEEEDDDMDAGNICLSNNLYNGLYLYWPSWVWNKKNEKELVLLDDKENLIAQIGIKPAMIGMQLKQKQQIERDDFFFLIEDVSTKDNNLDKFANGKRTRYKSMETYLCNVKFSVVDFKSKYVEIINVSKFTIELNKWKFCVEMSNGNIVEEELPIITLKRKEKIKIFFCNESTFVMECDRDIFLRFEGEVRMNKLRLQNHQNDEMDFLDLPNDYIANF